MCFCNRFSPENLCDTLSPEPPVPQKNYFVKTEMKTKTGRTMQKKG